MIRAPRIAFPLVLLMSASPALAHPGLHGSTGFFAGMLHPLTGLDHLLAMLLVGLWAGLAFPRHWWLCPAAFAVFMLAGFAYGTSGGSLPIAEMMILGSVVGLGVALLADLRPPLALSAGLVAFFAVGHGFTHGAEAGTADSTMFAAGFSCTTVLLQGIGLMIAARSKIYGQQARVRQAGGAIALVSGLIIALS